MFPIPAGVVPPKYNSHVSSQPNFRFILLEFTPNLDVLS